MRRGFTVIASLLGAGALSAMISVPAESHATLVESFPSAKQRLNLPLNTVKLLFSGRADARYSTISLEGEDGAVLAAGSQPQASRELQLPAPSLQPGRYCVRYRILSTDGDVVEGRVDFVVEE